MGLSITLGLTFITSMKPENGWDLPMMGIGYEPVTMKSSMQEPSSY